MKSRLHPADMQLYSLYLNKRNKINFSFCPCNSAWSGRYCIIQHKCNYAQTILYVSVFHLIIDRYTFSPFTKFEELIASSKIFSCIFSKGFSGVRCEIIDTGIVVSFAKYLSLSQWILVHFTYKWGRNIALLLSVEFSWLTVSSLYCILNKSDWKLIQIAFLFWMNNSCLATGLTNTLFYQMKLSRKHKRSNRARDILKY